MRVGALAAPAGLAVAAALITACSASQAVLSPAAGHGASSSGGAVNGAAAPVASHGAVSSPTVTPPAATASGGPATSASAPSAGLDDCAAWPAGSTGATLDVDAGANGHIYCVAIGDTVRLQLSGSELSAWKPVQLSGDSLMPVTVSPRTALMPAFPLWSYRAVRPGDTMLYTSRSCRALSPQAAAAPQPATALTAYFGGTPISPGCMGLAESFRVTIVVS